MKILTKPIISEKSLIGVQEGRYCFRVTKNANKHLIAQSVKDLYKVQVINVNIINVKNETKIVRGRYQANFKGYKKAIVTLKKGQKIPGFEEK